MLKAMYGPSIAISEHHEWRKHRRIAGPSFTESNNVLVWESTIQVISGYFTKWNRDGRGSIVEVSNFMEVTKQIAFMVFSTAGAYATWRLSCLSQRESRLWHQYELGLGQERNSQWAYYAFYACVDNLHTKPVCSHVSEMAPLLQ